MPQYYFDTFDGRMHRDEIGMELSDIAQVCFEVRRMIADMVTHGHALLAAILTVRDDESRTILTASISLHFDRPDTHH